MNLKFGAFVQGSEGPDVWDKELCFEARDIREALSLASGWAEEHGGHVMSVGQTEWDKKTVIAYRTKDHPAANGKVPARGDVEYAIELPLEDGRSLALHMGSKCFEILSNHLSTC